MVTARPSHLNRKQRRELARRLRVEDRPDRDASPRRGIDVAQRPLRRGPSGSRSGLGPPV